VCVLDDYEEAALSSADWAPVTSRARVSVLHRRLATPDEVVAALEPFDVVVAMRERTAFPRATLARLPGLRLLVTTGQRNAAIDLAACADLGIVVSATRNGGSPVVEMTWALILAALRDVPWHVAGMRSGSWSPRAGRELAGLTLGLVGVGRTGARMARIGRAFDMRVVGWSQNLTGERAAEQGVERVEKEELFRVSDVVSIHLVLSDRTRGVVGAAELRAMRPDAWLVNTSRGPICDEQALLTACSQRWIAGAALDVFSDEPLPADHPFRGEPNMLLSPHVGYVTRENLRLWFGDVVEDIVAFADGTPIRVLGPPT